MGRPRMIIVIRHAQSEGNQNRQIHQTIPDHRVKLTPEGWTQAHEAGRSLRSMLRPDDTLQIYTSPYRRTRETTEGILRTLTSDEPEPSLFNRQAIKVFEEPRLREQDFGNFQPDSDAMESMWKERANYGHFFFRIPNGESAADAYDRVSGFNETLWRSFSEKDFPSVCVLVTHGLMTRVFLMKWFHWSVEYFEDLRNVNHCEFVVMTRPESGGKYILKNELRTWSELRRKAAAEKGLQDDGALSIPARKRWGECPDDCDHQHDALSKKPKRDITASNEDASSSTHDSQKPKAIFSKDTREASNPQQHVHFPATTTTTSTITCPNPAEEDSEALPNPTTTACPPTEPTQEPTSDTDSQTTTPNTSTNTKESSTTAFAFSARLVESQRPRQLPNYIEGGRDFGGSFSGAATPAAPGSPTGSQLHPQHSRGRSGDYGFPRLVGARSKKEVDDEEKSRWLEASGMGAGARADALGDRGEDAGGAGEEAAGVEEGRRRGEEGGHGQGREEDSVDAQDDLGGAKEVARAKARGRL